MTAGRISLSEATRRLRISRYMQIERLSVGGGAGAFAAMWANFA